MNSEIQNSPLVVVAFICAGLALAIITWFLLRRPKVDGQVKLWLFLGLGIFPIGAAGAANIQGFEATTKREFCGSCHVMTPYKADSENKASIGLASRHARNELFGDQNCYSCHADYGMYGTVLTKAGGMRHVWLYYTQYSNMSLAEARTKIHIKASYPNANCMHCHSTEDQGWNKVTDHRAAIEDVRAGRVSCASPGCHGAGHPFSKDADPNLLPAELSP